MAVSRHILDRRLSKKMLYTLIGINILAVVYSFYIILFYINNFGAGTGGFDWCLHRETLLSNPGSMLPTEDGETTLAKYTKYKRRKTSQPSAPDSRKGGCDANICKQTSLVIIINHNETIRDENAGKSHSK